jgi:hypothetical protein
MLNLLVTIAIFCEYTRKKFQFPWDIFMVADGCGSMYQGQEHGMLIDQVVV